MISVVLISEASDSVPSQWQFDRVMAAIAYDLEVNIVFINKGKEQLNKNKSWKCLDLYGIENVFYLTDNSEPVVAPLFKVKSISHAQLKNLIDQSDIII